MSILFKATHAENVKVSWLAVQPQLLGAMFNRGEVDGTGGFTNSNVPAILEMDFTMDDLFVLKYSDFGADMHGLFGPGLAGSAVGVNVLRTIIVGGALAAKKRPARAGLEQADAQYRSIVIAAFRNSPARCARWTSRSRRSSTPSARLQPASPLPAAGLSAHAIQATCLRTIVVIAKTYSFLR